VIRNQFGRLFGSQHLKEHLGKTIKIFRKSYGERWISQPKIESIGATALEPQPTHDDDRLRGQPVRVQQSQHQL